MKTTHKETCSKHPHLVPILPRWTNIIFVGCYVLGLGAIIVSDIRTNGYPPFPFVESVYAATILPLEVSLPKKEKTVEVKELPLKEWAYNEFTDAGLKAYEGFMVIEGESHWDEQAFHVNTNGTIDLGCAEINSIWFNKAKAGEFYISPADALNCHKAIKWMIDKRKADGNWKAWTFANKIGLK